MLKLTKLHYEISDSTKKRIDTITEIYQEEVNQAQVIGKPIPEAPVVKLKNEDYKCTESVLFLDADSIESIEVTPDNDTQIVTKTGGVYLVKETPEEISKLKTDAKQS